jgi:hypothetical protein
MFDMKSPCPHCPFRTDVPGYLTKARAAEIARALECDGTFSCHKTVEHDEETGEGYDTAKSQHCAGATILLEKLEQPNQMMRISERLRLYDRTKLHMDAPVFEDFGEFIDHHAAATGRKAKVTR